MEFYLKTKEEYDAIVENCEAFYRADRFVEGCNVAIYDYRLASLSDFVDNEAFEMRGLCFVEQLDGTWQRNILMNKFFNIGQVSMDDLWEINIDGEKLRVEETHIFKVKSNAGNINDKFARDLTPEDDILGWDELKNIT